MIEATIEDLAIPTVLRGEQYGDEMSPYYRLCCIEHDFAYGAVTQGRHWNRGYFEWLDVKVRSSQPPRRTVKEWRKKSSQEQNHTQRPIQRRLYNGNKDCCVAPGGIGPFFLL
jgi:hypothetical protein